jgi:hypothetical protein
MSEFQVPQVAGSVKPTRENDEKKARRRGRRLILAVCAISLGASLSIASAAPAAASVSYGAGSGSEVVFCDAGADTIDVHTTVVASQRVLTYPGQLTAVRVQYYSFARNKWFSRGWRTGYAFSTFYAEENLALIPGRWLVYVDFGWWTGNQWVYGSEYAPVYWQVGVGRTTTCYL